VNEEKEIPENKETSTPPVGNENVSSKEEVSSPQLSTLKTQSESSTMEVHKHSHHVTRKKNWKEYFLEFFMLFLAVFLGFVAENMREHIVEKDRAKQYAKSLISDLKNDTAMVNSHIQQITRNVEKIDTLCAYVYEKNLNQLNNFDLIYKSGIGSYNPYTWSRATLEQIKSSGSLRYFGNDSIVKKVSAYDAFTRHIDYDYETDYNQGNKIFEKREQILDMNYPGSLSLVMLLDLRYDSLKNTTFYEEMRNLNKSLLTKDINDIKVLTNEALRLKTLIRVRRDFELPRLVKDATDLIHLLETEYNLN
jgi:hypothetical protein